MNVIQVPTIVTQMLSALTLKEVTHANVTMAIRVTEKVAQVLVLFCMQVVGIFNDDNFLVIVRCPLSV